MPLMRYDLYYLTKMFYRLLEEFQIACLTLFAFPQVFRDSLSLFFFSSEVSAVEQDRTTKLTGRAKISCFSNLTLHALILQTCYKTSSLSYYEHPF